MMFFSRKIDPPCNTMNPAIWVLLLFSVLTASMVHSHSGATGIVKERMDAMSDMGDRTKVVADMFKGKRAFEKTALVDAADAFILHGTGMTVLFPDTEESRTGSDTEASARIWDEWDDFSSQVAEFVQSSEFLKMTVTSTDEMGALRRAFFQTTKGCSGCHKRFRKPKG